MKKFLILFACLFLTGCITPDETYRTLLNHPHNAIAKAPSGAFGMSYKQKNIEYAVYAALASCDSYGIGCVLEQINGSRVTSQEAQDWRDSYNRNKKHFTIGPGERGGFVIVTDTGKRESKKTTKNTKKKKENNNDNVSQGSSGSAFFISSKGDIITNNHVIEGCRSQPKVKYKNKDVTANIVATDKMLDLALLKADLRNTKYISFSKDEPKKLQRIIVAGYPFGQYISDDLKFTSGIVSSLKGPGDDSTLVQVDAALNVGNSGGPIVDESSGQLVAVSVLTMDKSVAEGQNFGIKTSSVKNFLNANKMKVPFGFSFNRDVADSLEKSTLYVYCY